MITKIAFKGMNLIYNSTENSAASDKKKSIALSLLLFLSLIVLLFFINFWPPSNQTELVGTSGGGGGVTVNFGNADLGSGTNFTSKELEVKQIVKVTKAAPEQVDEILTSENSDANVAEPLIKNTAKKKSTLIIKNDNKPIATKKPIVKKTDDALANLLNGNSKGGDGNDKTSGNQGRSNGDISSKGYSGAGGFGSGNGGGVGNGSGSGNGNGSGSGIGGGNGNGIGNGSGYSLGNRKALSKPAPNYNCNEEGKVVVEITVDRNGHVISAKPGVKGTTNTANCLLSQAKIAALNTKWEPSNDAPDSQIGKIIYNFSLN